MDSSTASHTTPVSDDRMAHHLRTLAEEAEALLRASARAGDEKVTEARERLRDEVANLRSRLGDMEVQAGMRVKDAAHRTDEAVHAHPYTAMGAAAAIGLLAGLLIGRR